MFCLQTHQLFRRRRIVMKNMRIKILALIIFAMVFTAVTPAFSAGEPILVGGNYEMSGSVAAYGMDCVRAANLAFEQVNAKGGILNGRPLKLVTYDNQSDASQAIVGTSYLINEEKVVAILGAATSSLSMSIGPVVKSREIP
ncbi:MAG TPA: ethanolamine utilization protein EutJ, partial [Firmicutes bacterium]|nr:ethanolamine utilization protein EutJ [Bacillota bacterium]